MKNVIAYFVKYPILANIIIAITILAGVASFFNTSKSFFPTRDAKTINIQMTYPGASPEEVEEGITLKIEESIKSVVGVEEVFSTSSENFASIRVEVFDNYDIDEVFTDVKNAVDGISAFPVDAEKPLIFKQRPLSVTQWVALTGDVDLLTKKRIAEEIEDDMLAAGIVTQISVVGLNPREIAIEVSEDALSRYGLTFSDVANAVRVNNRDISGGSVKTKNEEILIRSDAKRTDAERIGEIVLRSNTDGTKLLVKDIAEIKEQFTDAPNKSTLNGSEAVWIQVNKLEDEDLEEISAYVTKYVDDFNATHSAVELTTAFNFFDYLGQRISMLTENGILGLVLVLISLGTFLSIRLSFWVAWGIPSSFLGMFIIGSFFGLTINMISLFGMILVIGILVDDGIVIAENIYSHFERTGNPIKSAINGTMEVLPAVATSVTTTMVAFSPLLLLTGGFEFLRDMAIVVITSLGFSLVEAFFVLPAHLASPSVLSNKKEDGLSYKIRKQINKAIDFMRYDLYGRMLQFTMKYKFISVCFMLALFPIVFGLFGGGYIKSTFFPNIPFSSFNVNLTFVPGTREDKVEDYLRKFEDAIWEVNKNLKEEKNDDEDFIQFTFINLGGTADGSESGSHAGGINVFYKELDGTGVNSYDLIDRIRTEIGPVPEAEKFNIGSQERFGKPVSIRLLGKNFQELEDARNFLKGELKKMPDLNEVQDDVAIGRREMQFELQPQAYFLGLTHNDIASQIRQGFFGEEVQRLQKGNDEVRVWVRYPNSGRLNIGQLEEMKIKTANNEEFPLTQLSDYEIERGFSGIKHYNTSRSVTVEAGLVNPFAEVPPIIEEVQSDIIPKLNAKFPGVSIDFGGQAEESAKAQREIGLYFGGAFLVIIFLIMITFRSFYQTVLVMSMIPLGWLGASIGHGIEGKPVSLLSAWGMIALSGVIINDAVVFIAKFNTNMKAGQTVYEAAFGAGIARFRPIILTSITTVLGLFPLIKEGSFQAQFLIPMAISVAYGVLIGTFIILLFLPPLILAFNDARVWAKWLWTGKKPTPESVERVIIDTKRLENFEDMNIEYLENGNGSKKKHKEIPAELSE
ncbi:MAG: efflux RND transporter permease subunit [Bacteroidota bacterium]